MLTFERDFQEGSLEYRRDWRDVDAAYYVDVILEHPHVQSHHFSQSLQDLQRAEIVVRIVTIVK
jgi:hypothetical protein